MAKKGVSKVEAKSVPSRITVVSAERPEEDDDLFPMPAYAEKEISLVEFREQVCVKIDASHTAGIQYLKRFPGILKSHTDCRIVRCSDFGGCMAIHITTNGKPTVTYVPYSNVVWVVEE